jgi:hypothetical protein
LHRADQPKHQHASVNCQFPCHGRDLLVAYSDCLIRQQDDAESGQAVVL